MESSDLADHNHPLLEGPKMRVRYSTTPVVDREFHNQWPNTERAQCVRYQVQCVSAVEGDSGSGL